MNPFCIPFSILNMGGALLAMDLGFMGPNYPINTACATGNYCLLKCAACCTAACCCAWGMRICGLLVEPLTATDACKTRRNLCLHAGRMLSSARSDQAARSNCRVLKHSGKLSND